MYYLHPSFGRIAYSRENMPFLAPAGNSKPRPFPSKPPALISVPA